MVGRDFGLIRRLARGISTFGVAGVFALRALARSPLQVAYLKLEFGDLSPERVDAFARV